MQHTLLVLHKLAQIHLCVHINRQPLPRLLLQRDPKLPNDLTAPSIAPKQILAADPILVARQRVLDGRSDRPVQPIARKLDKRRVKPDFPPRVPRAVDQDRLQNRLRAIDMLARTGGRVLALAVRLAAPGVDPRPLVAGHVVAPARVRHVDLVGAFVQHGFLEADVSQAFLRGRVGDVRAGLFGCAGGGREDYPCEAVGGEEAG
jgi:hypothetical protein